MGEVIGGRLLGLETELLLLDARGELSNRAAEVIAHSGNTGNLVPEFCRAVVETNPPPSASIRELEANLHTELAAAHTIVEALGISAAPICEVGPGNQAARVFDSRRYALFEEAVGARHCDIERSLCGTHLHVDHEEDLVGQYNLLQSMDPAFALMSSSSFVRGHNSVNCGRIELIRNQMFSGAPVLNKLLNYVSAEEDLNAMELARSRFILGRLTSTEETMRIFGGYNNGSSPLRKTTHTIEVRSADSNTPTFVVAMAALYKGVLRMVFGEDPREIRISRRDGLWGINHSEIVLPSYRTLKVMEADGIAMGVRSPLVRRYLRYLVDVAEEALSSDEATCLTPFVAILEHQRNVGDVISEMARRIEPAAQNTISASAAATISLFVAEQYLDDMNGGSQLLDMIRHGVG